MITEENIRRTKTEVNLPGLGLFKSFKVTKSKKKNERGSGNMTIKYNEITDLIPDQKKVI
jgi:hypothetical protein